MAFDKDEYRKNREEGKRGQGNDTSDVVGMTPADVEIGFSNNGKMVVKNREYRRQRYSLPTSKQSNKRKKRK